MIGRYAWMNSAIPSRETISHKGQVCMVACSTVQVVVVGLGIDIWMQHCAV